MGKTFVGSVKATSLGEKKILVICQKSKIEDWVEHFKTFHSDYETYDLTNREQLATFVETTGKSVGVVNYELAFRRMRIADIEDFTLMLDESSLIQNEKTKRSRFILNYLKPKNVILLSGTPTAGKYENLWSQLRLLGWGISKKLYWNQYVTTKTMFYNEFPVKIVTGYKNVDRLKRKLKENGAVFMKAEEAIELPAQTITDVRVNTTEEYRTFRKDRVVQMPNGETIVGDSTFANILRQRQLCSSYNTNKMDALKDLLESTNDRVIVFYNFNEEMNQIRELCKTLERPLSEVNGQTKDLKAYEANDDSVTAVNFQAGAMGLNLQKANKMVFLSPTLSCENYMQSLKRIHRVGQERSCFYWRLICRDSIEMKIYKALERGVDYTEELFRKEES